MLHAVIDSASGCYNFSTVNGIVNVGSPVLKVIIQTDSFAQMLD